MLPDYLYRTGVFRGWSHLIVGAAYSTLLALILIWFAKQKTRQAVQRGRDWLTAQIHAAVGMGVASNTPAPNTGAAAAAEAHMCKRITEQLKSAFPNVSWQWRNKPEQFATAGGSAEIELVEADGYTSATVLFNNNFDVTIELVQSLTLADVKAGEPKTKETSQKPAAPGKASTEKPKKLVDAWMSQNYRTVREVGEELNVDGIRKMYLDTEGNLTYEDDDIPALRAQLDPLSQTAWPKLIEALKAKQLKGKIIDEAYLQISWEGKANG